MITHESELDLSIPPRFETLSQGRDITQPVPKFSMFCGLPTAEYDYCPRRSVYTGRAPRTLSEIDWTPDIVEPRRKFFRSAVVALLALVHGQGGHLEARK